MTGTGIVGLAVGTVIGSQAFPKTVEVAAPAEEAAPAAGEAAAGEAAAPAAMAGFTLRLDPYHCTGCMACAAACAEKWSAELFPEQTSDTVNLEFARIRPMRFQYVDVASHLLRLSASTMGGRFR